MNKFSSLMPLILAVCFSASPAISQFTDNGSGNSNSSGASAFGQQGAAAFAPTTDQIRNSGLGVRILFVGKNADGKTLTISAELQNVTEEPIFISLVGPPPAAIDTQGVTYQLTQASGLPQCRSLLNDHISSCFRNFNRMLPAAAFSVLQPGASAIVATTFSAKQVSTSGFLSVSMNVALASGSRPADERDDDVKLENVAISFPLITLEVAK